MKNRNWQETFERDKIEIELNNFLKNHFQDQHIIGKKISFFFNLKPETYGILLENFSYEIIIHKINELEVVKQFPNFQFVSVKLYLFMHSITFLPVLKPYLHILYNETDATLIKLCFDED
jgi:hypothetical protein